MTLIVVVSANGNTHFPGCENTSHEETYLLLVVVSDGVGPIFFIFLSLVHLLQHSRKVVHGLSFLHLFDLLMVGVEFIQCLLVVSAYHHDYLPTRNIFLPILFCANLRM